MAHGTPRVAGMPAIGKWAPPAQDLTPARKDGGRIAAGAYAYRV
jgi:hypothetical protein